MIYRSPHVSACIALAALALVPSVSNSGIPKEFPEKKLIAAGWDSPTPEALVQNLKLIEALPFHGVRVRVAVTTPDGGKADFYRVMQRTRWEKQWFLSSVEMLRKARSEKLTENFLSVGSGSTVDWFDDEAWEQVVDHFRIAAWVAKEGGLRGILFNPEVGIKQPAFSYNRQLERERYSFAEYAAKVRERGRAVMAAMAEEYPDMVFFSMFLNSGQVYNPFYQSGGPGATVSNWYLNQGEPVEAGPKGPLNVQQQIAPLERIEGGSYNLLPAFLNGLLDVVPPEMVLIDGLEQTYVTTERAGFLGWAHNVHNQALALVAPENRRKYRGQVEAGFGIYIDPYVNQPGSKYYVGPETEGGSRAERFGKVVLNALETTDRYVWLWGERHRWWPTDFKNVSPQSWEEVLPGVTKALEEACSPGLKATRELQAASERFPGPGRNLLVNGAFDQPGLEMWSPEGNSSFVSHDLTLGADQPGALKVSGGPVAIAQSAIRTSKGTGIYGIRAKIRQEGDAKGGIRIRWRKNEGPFLLRTSDNIYLRPSPELKDGEWGAVEGVVAVPRNQNRLVVQAISFEGQKTGGSVWFDDIEVYRLDQ